jgi:DNA-binding transcriptional MocR family regulator
VIARTLIHPGDCFLVNRTTYSGAIDVLTAAGARLIGVPSDDEGPDPAALERLASSHAKGFYLMPNCQNPTGEVVSQRRREFLVDWSHRARIPIIEDDYGSDLMLDDEQLPPALRALDADVVYIGTFSKKLLPALRVGFMVCPRGLKTHVSALRHAMDLGTSPLMQHSLAEFIERGYLLPHLRRVKAEYRNRRDALERSLASHLPAQVRWRSPRTGVVLWLPLPSGQVSAMELTEEARRNGVAVLPGSQFAAGSQHEDGVRLTFCSESPERLALAAKRLGKAFATLESSRLRARRTRHDADLEMIAAP